MGTKFVIHPAGGLPPCTDADHKFCTIIVSRARYSIYIYIYIYIIYIYIYIYIYELPIDRKAAVTGKTITDGKSNG